MNWDTRAPARSEAPAPAPASTPTADPTTPVDWRQLLIDHRSATNQLLDRHEHMARMLQRMHQPAQPFTVVLDAQHATVELRELVELPTLSVGVLNLNPITVYWSAVGSAGAAARAYAVPPNALLVLPVGAAMIEVGAAPADLVAGNAVVFVFRYFTVQPGFLGKGA